MPTSLSLYVEDFWRLLKVQEPSPIQTQGRLLSLPLISLAAHMSGFSLPSALDLLHPLIKSGVLPGEAFSPLPPPPPLVYYLPWSSPPVQFGSFQDVMTPKLLSPVQKAPLGS